MSVPRRTQRVRLFVGFLAMLVAAGLLFSAGTAQAGLISINIGPTGFNIGGINGGVAGNNVRSVSDFPISGNAMNLWNYSFLQGMIPQNGLGFATGISGASPVKFSLNGLIDSSSSYNTSGQESAFRRPAGVVSPDFGSGSYMGFRTSQNNYGWLEVTWTASSSEFQILSGAYESTPNVAVLAGAAAVPEPSTCASLLAGLACGGYSLFRRRNAR